MKEKDLFRNDMYDISNIIEVQCQYMWLLSGRNIGKSFALIRFALEDFLKNNNQFMYLRRWGLEAKPYIVEAYFGDFQGERLKYLSNGKYDTISCWSGRIYLGNTTDNGQITHEVTFGFYRSLAGSQHFKSTQYPLVYNIALEEAVEKTDKYLPDEPDELQDFVSTIARDRKVRVFLIGNKISRLCPYFTAWGLSHVPEQKEGSIETYTVVNEDGTEINIAVEMCTNTRKRKNTMFFGRVSKGIVNNAWVTQECPHLPLNYKEYVIVYMVNVYFEQLIYCIELLKCKNDTIVFIHTVNKPNARRIIKKDVNHSPLESTYFYPITKGDKLIIEHIKKEKIAYSDNLVGTEFKTVMEHMVKKAY